MIVRGQFPGEIDEKGCFVRQGDSFRGWIHADPASPCHATAGRYHLYVSLACPWAHRTIIIRKLKKLEDVIPMTIVDPIRDDFGWRFTFEPDQALPLLALDREGIKRAVINMLDNAVAALTPPNGVEPRIDIRTRYDRAMGIVGLEVADTGCGIDPNARTRLFEPYFSTKQGGTGLGLAIVSTIVADHQGFVRVKDNEPRGSRFVIELPVKGQVEQVVLH